MSDTNHSGQSQVHRSSIMRSPLGRVRGLGAAGSGTGHWWAQRLTAIALLPLSLWFIFSVLHLVGASHDQMLAWFAGPVPVVLMLCLILAMFYHLHLGLQVVVEDYVHQEPARLATLLIIRAAIFVMALACIVSVLRLGL